MSDENPKWMPRQRFWTDGERNRLVREHGEMAALLEDIADQLDRADTDEECGKAANDIEPKARALLAKIKKGA